MCSEEREYARRVKSRRDGLSSLASALGASFSEEAEDNRRFLFGCDVAEGDASTCGTVVFASLRARGGRPESSWEADEEGEDGRWERICVPSSSRSFSDSASMTLSFD